MVSTLTSVDTSAAKYTDIIPSNLLPTVAAVSWLAVQLVSLTSSPNLHVTHI